MKRVWMLFMMAGLLALAGCPKPALKGGTAKGETVSDTTEAAAPASAPADQTTADNTGAADNAAQAPAAGSSSAGNAAGSSTAEAHTPTAEELKGKWFALYGGIGPAASTYSFADGHQIEFTDSGMAIWHLGTDPDSPTNQFPTHFKLSGDSLELTAEPGAKAGDNFKATPLAFGRNDEVGLTGSHAPSATAGQVFRFVPRLDGGFLALLGHSGELMVYGKVDNTAPAKVPDVSGNWKLAPASGQVYDATVKMDGDDMVADWGPYHSEFRGTYSHGYFIGQINSRGGNAFAAVAPAPGGSLDGVISTEPYSGMSTTFDFKRASQ